MNVKPLQWSTYVNKDLRLIDPGPLVEFDHPAFFNALGITRTIRSLRLAAHVKGYQGPRYDVPTIDGKTSVGFGVTFLTFGNGRVLGYQVQICPRCSVRTFFYDETTVSQCFSLVTSILREELDVELVDVNQMQGFEAVLNKCK